MVFPLQRHVVLHIGKMRVSGITPQDIKGALAPIWRTKFPTAEKALQRTRTVLHEGRLMGFGCDPFSAEAAQRMTITADTIEEAMVYATDDLRAVLDALERFDKR
ncbi:phage integrase central domain-containing protein [Rhodovulum kholense]|uniref:Phage integrase central domain-containing protein n=1 Tax=Rhodovulum kholense TaxID=453584 RepID=A0A8E3AS79_9RHOB|nr:hypothetical protein C8N38_101223 [Rhodovulum kholense]